MRATISRSMGPVVFDIPHHTRCRVHTRVGRLGIGDKTGKRQPLIIHADLQSPAHISRTAPSSSSSNRNWRKTQ
eukprot:5983589-Pyramimonas_sp.AAC.1